MYEKLEEELLHMRNNNTSNNEFQQKLDEYMLINRKLS